HRDDVAADALSAQFTVDIRHLDVARHAAERDARITRHRDGEVDTTGPVPPPRILGAYLYSTASIRDLDSDLREQRFTFRFVGMSHPLHRVDLDVVATATGDRNIASDVLEVEGAVASEANGA